MERTPAPLPVSIGLRAKTGRAIAVVVRGPLTSPVALHRREISLCDPEVPATREPYHAVMELPWASAVTAARPVVKVIQAVATRVLDRVAAELRAEGLEPCAVGIVGGSANAPERLGNPHVRAHAAEGRLFREVLEGAAEACGLAWQSFPERGFTAVAASRLGRPESELARRLLEMGQAVGRPWRSDEKAAALAAWVALATVQGRSGVRE